MKRLTITRKLSFYKLSVFVVLLCLTTIYSYGQKPKIWATPLIDNFTLDYIHQDMLDLNTPLKKVNVSNYSTVSGIIKNDFLLNDDIAGGCSQRTPAIAVMQNGNYVVVWSDGRKGYYKIYARLFNTDNQPLCDDFMVNDENDFIYPAIPAVSASNGSFVITWYAFNADYSDCVIFAQKYDLSGNRIGGNFKVSDDTVKATRYKPDIAMHKDGSFVIAWTDWRNYLDPNLCDVYAQIYDTNGIPKGANLLVKSDTLSFMDYFVSVAIDSLKNMYFAWQRTYDIYSQRMDSTGTKIGTTFMVNDDSIGAKQRNPDIAVTPDGKVVAAWQDDRNGNSQVYMQMYDAFGASSGSNVKVSDESAYASSSAEVAFLGNKDVVITWVGYNAYTYAQNLDSLGNLKGSNYPVSIDSNTVFGRSEVASSDSIYIIAWVDSRNGQNNHDIFCQKYDIAQSPIDGNLQINSDENTSWQTWPVIATNENGMSVVCWLDGRDGNYDYYAQRFNADGNLLGSNTKVNDTPYHSYRRNASVAVSPGGKYSICWIENQLLLKIYDQNGAQLSPVAIVDTFNTSNAHVAYTSGGSLAVVWERSILNPGIYCCIYDSTGNVIRQPFKINEVDSGASQPLIAMSDAKSMIAWLDARNSLSNLYAQYIDVAGNLIGDNFMIADAGWSSLSMAENGFYVVARDNSCIVQAQLYDSLGNKVAGVLDVTENPSSVYQSLSSSVAFAPDGSKFIVGWTDYSNILQEANFMAQVYNGVTGEKIGTNVIINDDSSGAWAQKTSMGGVNVVSNGNNIYYAWSDNRRNLGWDVYAKITDWGIAGVKSGKEEIPSTISYALLQNSPNPIINQTMIRYQLAKSGKVSLKIYNTLGQLVSTLVDNYQQPGAYSANWKGRDNAGKTVANGVYFYQLISGDYKATKKMVIIKGSILI